MHFAWCATIHSVFRFGLDNQSCNAELKLFSFLCMLLFWIDIIVFSSLYFGCCFSMQFFFKSCGGNFHELVQVKYELVK